MATFDVNPTELIIKTAEKLKDIPEMQAPEWARFVKTGHGRERPPVQGDWWHVRAAAVLRKLTLKGPIGVNKLRVQYGNRKNYGMAPEHFVKASGSILRKILQQLEKAGLAKKAEKDAYKGRIATPQGIALLDKTAAELLKVRPPKKVEAAPKVEKPKVEKKPEVKKPLEKKKEAKTEKKEEVKTEKPKAEEKKEELKAEKKEVPKTEKKEEPKIEKKEEVKEKPKQDIKVPEEK